jgi:hypothetical protein
MALSVLLLLAPELIATAAFAAQDVQIQDGGTVQITLSAHDVSRIAKADGSPLDRILAPDGTLDIKPGDGDVFVRPLDVPPGKALSFFVRDANGATYTLVAGIADLPAQTVLLHTPAVSMHHAPAHDKADPYLRRAMAGGDNADDFSAQGVHAVAPVWKQTETLLETRWSSGSDLHGETWSVRNITHDELRLDEAQFAGFYSDVRAVAITQQVLHPADVTTVYIVRGPATGAAK